MNKNIILIGFMGVGKTTFGKILSKELNFDFIDTDLYIEKLEGMKISEIFEKKGEPYFREVELNVAKELSKKEKIIMGTGGGFVKNHNIMCALKETGTIVYLKSSAQNIYKNVKKDKTRPLLNVKDKMKRIEELLEERTPLYEKYADVTVDVTGLSFEEITANIIKLLEENK